MSGLFPHNVIEQKEGFVFLVQPADDTDEDSIEAAETAQGILEEAWPTAPSELTVDEVTDAEEAELIYADAMQLLEEAEFEDADQFVISGVIIVGKLVIVNCALTGESSDDDEEEDDDDNSVEASEEDFD